LRWPQQKPPSLLQSLQSYNLQLRLQGQLLSLLHTESANMRLRRTCPRQRQLPRRLRLQHRRGLRLLQFAQPPKARKLDLRSDTNPPALLPQPATSPRRVLTLPRLLALLLQPLLLPQRRMVQIPLWTSRSASLVC